MGHPFSGMVLGHLFRSGSGELVVVEIGFWNDRIGWSGGLTTSGALKGGEAGAAGWGGWGEAEEADGFEDVVVDGFHASADAVGLVPEAGAAGIFEEFCPPGAVRFGAGEG